MTKYILRQLKRGAVYNAMFCLLLALAGVLLSLGAGLLFTAVSGVRDVSSAFTTIAVPDVGGISRYAAYYVRNNDMPDIVLFDGSVFTPEDDIHFFESSHMERIESDIMDNIADSIYASGEFDVDTRRVFGGYIPGIVPYINRLDLWLSRVSHTILFSPNATAAFIAVAENVRYEHIQASDYALGNFMQEIKTVTFAVEETLLIHPAYFPVEARLGLAPPMRSFEMTFTAQRADSTPMIEEGARYFVFGRSFVPADSNMLRPHGLLHIPTEPPTGWVHTGFLWLPLGPASVLSSPDDMAFHSHQNFITAAWEISEDEWPIQTYSRVFEDSPFNDPYLEINRFDTGYRWLIQLPKDPSEPLPDALQNEIDRLLEMGSKSVNSFIVMTTGRLDSYFRFNQNQARITEGRDFTGAELEAGARVAIVNNLTEGVEVGDIITMQIYEAAPFNLPFFQLDIYTPIMRLWNITQPFSPVSLISEPMEFEVIGKFSAPMEDESEQAIASNAIFIPDNAVAEFPFIVPEMTDTLRRSLDERGIGFDEWLFGEWPATGYLYPRNDFRRMAVFNTIIVPNGEIEAFSDAINAILPGYAAFFRIYDQGFSTVSGALDNLLRNGTVILVLCLAGWLIAVLVFCLFYIQRKGKEAGLLYALGVSKKHRFRWLFVQCLIVIVLSQAIAFGVSSVLYERTVDFAIDAAQYAGPEQAAIFTDAVMAQDGAVYEFHITRDPWAIPLTIAGASIVLLIISGAMATSIAGKGVQALRRGSEL